MRNNSNPKIRISQYNLYNKIKKTIRTSFLKNISPSKHNTQVEIEKSKLPERITAYSTVVLTIATCLLALYTYKLFQDAQQANGRNIEAITAAKKSADASVSSAAEQKSYDSSSRISDSIRDIKNQIRDSLNFKKQEKLFEAQILQLNESRLEFEKTNEPYLQIANPTIKTLTPNQPLYIEYSIENLGNYPVKILDAKTITAIRIKPIPVKELLDFKHDSSVINSYVIKGTPYKAGIITEKPISQNQIFIINTQNLGEYYVYALGYIKYKNLVTLKEKIYNFEIKIPLTTNPEFIINENVDVGLK